MAFPGSHSFGTPEFVNSVDDRLEGQFYRSMTGRELKEIREFMKLSKSELGRRIGLTRQTILALEQNRGQIDLVYEWAIIGLWCDHQGLFSRASE